MAEPSRNQEVDIRRHSLRAAVGPEILRIAGLHQSAKASEECDNNGPPVPRDDHAIMFR